MNRYRLLASQHEQPDPNDPHWKPTKAELAAGAKPPVRKYVKGDIITTDKDLAALFGADKFQLLSGTEGEVFPSQAKFPGGQVSSGFQVSEGAPGDTKPPEIRAESAEDALRLATHQPKHEAAKPEAKPAPAKPKHTSADLHNKTVAELRELAEDEEIDLKHAKTKDELVKAILES
jgi:hypothetical protein